MSFTPNNISGLSLWLDSSDITTLYQNSSLTTSIVSDGQSVGGWRDKSGSGRNAIQTNNALRPVYKSNIRCGNGIIRFVGGLSLNTSGWAFPTTQFSIFVVSYLATNNSSWQRIINGYSSDHGIVNGAYGANFTTFTGSGSNWNDTNANTPATDVLTKWVVTDMIVNSSVLTSFVNGTALDNKVGTTNPFTDIAIGGGGAFGNQPWNGDIAEIIIYNKSLSTTERQQIEGFLAWKWGTIFDLPTTHPYASVSPSGKPFLPNLLPNCVLWLDAADPNANNTTPSNGAKISIWKDKSPSGYNLTQATSANQPTYINYLGKNYINFTKTNSNYLENTSMNIDYRNSTVFILFKRKSVSASNDGIFAALTYTSGADWANQAEFEISTATEVASNSSGANDGNKNDLNVTNYSFVFNNNSLTTYRNFGTSSVISKSMGLTSVPTKLYLGIRRDGSPLNYPADIYIGEVIIYNTVLSTTLRQQVEGYLAWKWGISSYLPTTHVSTINSIIGTYTNDTTPIANFISSSINTTTNLLIDAKSSLKSSALSAANKALIQKEYINSLRAKNGSNTLSITDSSGFFVNSNSVQSGLSAKNVNIILPDVSANTILFPASISSTNYYHMELPLNTNISISNAIPSVSLSYNGTNVVYNSQTKNLGDTVYINGNSYKIVALGSVTLDQTSGAGGDPHIYPLIGSDYDLPNEKARFLLFDNKKNDLVRIVCECDYLTPQEIADSKFRNKSVTEGTFMTKLWIRNNENIIEINMKDLSVTKESNGFEIGEIYEDKLVFRNRYTDLQLLKFKIDFDGKSRMIKINTSMGDYTIKISMDINCADHRNHIELHGPEIETGIGGLISEKLCRKILTPF